MNKGKCRICGDYLPPKRTKYCSPECAAEGERKTARDWQRANYAPRARVRRGKRWAAENPPVEIINVPAMPPEQYDRRGLTMLFLAVAGQTYRDATSKYQEDGKRLSYRVQYEARKAWYEFYRDGVLTFSPDIELPEIPQIGGD